MNKVKITILSIFFMFSFFLISSLNNNIYAAVDCKKIILTGGNPADLANCGSPDEIAPSKQGRSLNEIILLISNTLALIAVFFSIIGVIVGVIYLVKSQANKNAYEEAKGIITNSLLAFIIVAALWIIVRLIFNTFGIGDLAPQT